MKTRRQKPRTSPRDATSSPELVRLNKYLATSGVCSRRKADEMILAGRVFVNGKAVTELGVKINPSKDKVFFNEKQVLRLEIPVYILFNKPKDCITTASDERGRTTVLDYVKVKQRVFPVGRLDRNTTGVLLLTNDGELSNRLMHPSTIITKAYEVTLDRPIRAEDAAKLAAGVRLSDGVTAPAEVVTSSRGRKKNLVGIVIHEGKNRQVHRMFGAVGYEVEKLDRVAYADLTHEGLARGAWRFLKRQELRRLKERAGIRPDVDLDSI
jgi:23S rRNA pseudouridine2605 synthase